MRCGDDAVDVPVVEPDLLAADAAYPVDDDESVWTDAAHELAQCRNLRQHAGRSVGVGDCDELVLLLLQGFLDFVELWPIAYRCFELRGLDTVCFEAVRKRVGEIAGVKHEHFIPWLGQIACDLVPAQCARTDRTKGCDAVLVVWKSLRSIDRVSPKQFTNG